MSLESKHVEQDVVVDKFHMPLATYVMTVRDYVVRPDATAGAMTVTLPSVAEAKGKFYSIIAQYADNTNTITITHDAHSAGWSEDLVLNEKGRGAIFYSDGMEWSYGDMHFTSSLVAGAVNLGEIHLTMDTAGLATVDAFVVRLTSPVALASSVLTLPDSTTFDESQTFESGDQVVNGVDEYYWTSINQTERIIPGEEFPSAKDGASCGPGLFTPNAGLCYDTTGNENKVWSLQIDPALSNNPFSLRAFGDVQNSTPTSIRLIPVPGSIAVNNPPGLSPVGDQIVYQGTSADVALSAPDLEGDAVTLTGSNLPSFASVIEYLSIKELTMPSELVASKKIIVGGLAPT